MGSLLCSVQLFSFNNCCTSIIMKWFLVVLCIQATFASRVKRGGSCETTDDCVAPNVCSKWGWCQWTKIYGEEGPSQGASAPGAGRAGQCKTSADCASRVPYCSKLGYCHGGRLPFDEAQLEINSDEEAQGFINNNPPKNSPILKKSQSTSSARTGTNTRPKNGGNGRTQTGNGQKNREMDVVAVISKIEGNNNQTNKEGGHLIKILPLRLPVGNVLEDLLMLALMKLVFP